MSDLKSTGIGIVLIGLAFGLPSVLLRLNLSFTPVIQLIIQLGIVATALYYIAGDEN